MTTARADLRTTQMGMENPAPVVTNATDLVAAQDLSVVLDTSLLAQARWAEAMNRPLPVTATRGHVNARSLSEGVSPREMTDQIATIPAETQEGRNRDFMVLQEWEGVVLSVRAKTFLALLSDQTRKSRPDEQANFPKAEVSDDDLALLQLGAVFRWTIGFLKNSGDKSRTSKIVFRRLPAWTEKEIGEADRDTERLASFFEAADHRGRPENEARRTKRT